jgi:hypothetical protein
MCMSVRELVEGSSTHLEGECSLGVWNRQLQCKRWCRQTHGLLLCSEGSWRLEKSEMFLSPTPTIQDRVRQKPPFWVCSPGILTFSGRSKVGGNATRILTLWTRGLTPGDLLKGSE